MKSNLEQLTDPHVRRLAWSLLSPPMAQISTTPAFDICQWHEAKHVQNWLKQLNAQPTSLHDYILAGNHRLLGSYFERLWQFFFNQYPGWTLLADHIQVIHEKQTLGELDLLVESPKGEVLHIELATKWYLQIPGQSGAHTSDWLGPQTKDRLDLKIKKLEEKQFPFANDERVMQHLKQANLPPPQYQFLIMKGGLFAQQGEHYEKAQCIPTDLVIHPWCHHKDIRQCFAQDHVYRLLDKHAWLGPALSNSNLENLSYEALIQAMDTHFNDSAYPYALMVADFGPTDQASDSEKQRIMVVHNHWPNTNRKPC